MTEAINMLVSNYTQEILNLRDVMVEKVENFYNLNDQAQIKYALSTFAGFETTLNTA